MLIIESMGQLAKLEHCFSKEVYCRLQDRLGTLHKTYCACGIPPLAQFSLADLGPIFFVQSYHEIEHRQFESIWTEHLQDAAFFVALHPTNNEYCGEYWIPHSILTEEQMRALYEEC